MNPAIPINPYRILIPRSLAATYAAPTAVKKTPTNKPKHDTTRLVSLQSLIFVDQYAHKIADILCSEISVKDAACVCCEKPMRTASNFNKYHIKCLMNMAGQLSETKRAEASQQKRRIKDAVKDSLRKRVRAQPRDGGDDQPSPNDVLGTPIRLLLCTFSAGAILDTKLASQVCIYTSCFSMKY